MVFPAAAIPAIASTVSTIAGTYGSSGGTGIHDALSAAVDRAVGQVENTNQTKLLIEAADRSQIRNQKFIKKLTQLENDQAKQALDFSRDIAISNANANQVGLQQKQQLLKYLPLALIAYGLYYFYKNRS